jgi:hypothetical protein
VNIPVQDLLDNGVKFAATAVTSGLTAWFIARWNYEKTIRTEMLAAISALDKKHEAETLAMRTEHDAQIAAIEARHLEAQTQIEKAFDLFVKEEGQQWRENSTQMGRLQGMVELFVTQQTNPARSRRTG